MIKRYYLKCDVCGLETMIKVITSFVCVEMEYSNQLGKLGY